MNEHKIIKFIPLPKKLAIAKLVAKNKSEEYRKSVAQKNSNIHSDDSNNKTAPKRKNFVSSLQIILLFVVIAAIVTTATPPLRNAFLQNDDIGNFTQEKNNSTSSTTRPNASDPNNSKSDSPPSSEIATNPNTDNAEPNGDSSSDQNANPLSSISSQVRNAILKYYNVSEYSQIVEGNAASKINQIYSITDSANSKVIIRLNLNYTDTNRNEVKAIANQVMTICRDEVPNLTVVTASSLDSYFVETVGR